MRTRRHLLAAAVCLAAGLLPAASRADVAAPVTVHLAGPFDAARAGVPFVGVLQVDVEPGHVLDDVAVVERDGWRLQSLRRLPGADGEFPRFEVRAVPGDPGRRLAVDVVVDGRTVHAALDLSPAAHRNATATARLQRVDAPRSRPYAGSAFPGRPAPFPRELTVDRTTIPESDPAAKTGAKAGETRTITVHGTLGAERTYDYGEGVHGDGAWIGLDGAAVYLYDIGESIFALPSLLGSGYSDSTGNFSFTFTWDPAARNDDDPDLKLAFALESPWTSVVEPTSLEPYAGETDVYWNVAGTDLDLTGITPVQQIDSGRFILYTYLQQCYEFYQRHDGANDNVPLLTVLHPDGWPRANGHFAHFPDDFHEWYEDVPFHERGHQWAITVGAFTSDYTYCDPAGNCDKDPANNDCGHCAWCAEDAGVAFNEGLANWIGVAGPPEMAAVSGNPLLSMADFETVSSTCSTPGDCDCDPLNTEGFFAALLNDLADDADDSDPRYAPPGADVLSLGNSAVFDLLRQTTSAEAAPDLFLAHVRDLRPTLVRDLWSTGANNGYDLDVQAPGAPGNFASPSHPVGSHLWDQTVNFTWTAPTDDWSGAGGYSIRIAASPLAPDTVPEVTDPAATTWTTGILNPGTWYATIRAVDRAGHWSGVMATYGPFTVEQADPLDLTFRSHIGWAETVVPREDATATGALVPAPVLLRGDGTLTYANLRGGNDATLAPSPDIVDRFELDGEVIGTVAQSPVPGGDSFYHINRGPYYVRGGRHVFAGRIDADDDATETNENNNAWGDQWVWVPGSSLPVDRDQRFTAPPKRDGGWDTVDGTPWYNVRGVRFLPTGYWTAVVLWPDERYADHDLRLHAAATGPTDGFTTNRGWSSRPAGCTDAVFINRNVEPTPPTQPWDAGVLDYGAVASNFHVRVVESGWLDLATVRDDTLGVDEMLHLLEFFVSSADTGWYNVTLRTQPWEQTLRLNLFGSSMATGSLGSGLAIDATEEATGLCSFDVHVTDPGYHAVAVYRDAYQGNDDLGYSLRIGPSTPELSPNVAAGWAGAVVPRDHQDLAYPWTSVPEPDTLSGTPAVTYAYVNMHNTGPFDAGTFRVQLLVDGAPGPAYDMTGGVAAGAERTFTTGGGFAVRGGWHTLGMHVDSQDAISESLEDNNAWARQWYWAPAVVPIGPAVVQAAPPDRTGGWSDLPPNVAARPNYVAARTPVLDPGGPDGQYAAVAMVPEAGSDYDLEIFPARNGTGLVGGVVGASYGWGPGESDFILINLPATTVRQFDVAIEGDTGVAPYHFQVVGSEDLGTEPYGLGAERTMAATDLLQLFSLDLAAGDHHLDLQPVAGGIDWGLSLYRPSLTWVPKSYVLNSTAVSWLAGPGQGEGFDFTVAQPGVYLLAVWKAGAADLGLAGSYRLDLRSHVSDVPAAPPVRTAIREVNPNPFNPRTVVAFELDSEGAARLGVYSLRGRLVRLLADERLPAGRHVRVWDGLDDHGQRVSSGVYLVRLVAGATVDYRKVTLLK